MNRKMLPTSISASKHPSMVDALGWLLQSWVMVTPYWHAKHLAFLWSWQQPFSKCTQKKNIRYQNYFTFLSDISRISLMWPEKMTKVQNSSEFFWKLRTLCNELVDWYVNFALDKKKQNLGTLTISSLFDNSEEKKKVADSN